MIHDDFPQMKLLREGSQPAFEELYNRYSGKLYHFILKITGGNTWQAEELVQRTFVKIWENRLQIDPQKSFLSYICTIAKNMSLNEWEHQAVEFIYQEYFLQNENMTECSTDKTVDVNFLEKIVDQLAEKLPPARKQIFIMSKRKGYSAKEIAKELNLAPTTVQSQLTKALEFMRKHLAKYYYGV
ncbi:MAG: RNA polymerase sigma-70 factor, partial [Dysgonamonadaceae bacterium]|nr:RNA polymerase sigma-70 factor [Dysgonamonadaceae bacterium]